MLTGLALVTDITWFLEDNLARQFKKHVLHRILQENFSKP